MAEKKEEQVEDKVSYQEVVVNKELINNKLNFIIGRFDAIEELISKLEKKL